MMNARTVAAQHVLLDLPRRGLGQFADEVHFLGALEVGEPIASELAQLVGGDGRAGAQDGRRGNVFALLGRIFSAGPWLSREEFSAIAAFQPLFKRDFLRLLWETNSLLDRTRPLASRCVKRGRLGDEILRAWWNEVWAVGHLSVLANMDSRDVIAELPAEAPERGCCRGPRSARASSPSRFAVSGG